MQSLGSYGPTLIRFLRYIMLAKLECTVTTLLNRTALELTPSIIYIRWVHVR